MKNIIGAILVIAVFAWLFSLCSPAGKNSTGHEYMPDMYHSTGYEANVYSAYSWNHWDAKSTFTKAELSKPRAKVDGTIARGYTSVYYGNADALSVVRGKNAPNAISAPVNGETPFYYANTEEERLRCEQEMRANPFPITKAGLAKAKPLYEVYCGICHGNDGGGNGALVATEKYPAQPKNLMGDDMIAAGNGRYYFAIMYGKNVMGGYSDKLSFEERWQVIHYIRSLQAKAKNLPYDETPIAVPATSDPLKGTPSGATQPAPSKPTHH